jgi:carboxypeptidase Taq
MENKLNQLKQLLYELNDLEGINALVGWDQQTYMPQGAAENRGNHLETLSRIIHLKRTSDELSQLLDDLMPFAGQMDPEADDACLIRKAHRELQKQKKIPTDWVTEFARVTALGQSAWEKARSESNFGVFKPHLKRIIELRQVYSSFFAPYDHVYDPQLDDFEEGLKTADVMAVFDVLRQRQVELLRQIATRPQINNDFLHQPFDDKSQWDFGVEVLSQIGFEWKRGRQDKSAHPFTTTIGMDDVRITTRVLPNYLPAALFGSVHEMGHALYELGFDRSLSRTMLASGTSMAIHESQSRLWENLVGRSLPFWTCFYPKLQSRFPSQLGNVDLMTFYRGANQVKPSLIRVEADEATYNLHIMLRLELEIAMLEGQIDVADLPDAWNQKAKAYLGLTPPNDAQGVLQDVHWSFGGIGYFPTYALGNVVSAQWWEKIKTDLPNLDEQIQNGQFGDLLGWLRQAIHRHGAKFAPQILVEKVTGSKINPQPYLNYLEAKYQQIYQI